MACIGSSRLCARAEKLCQFGHFSEIRKKLSTTFVKSRVEIERAIIPTVKQCQVSRTLLRFHFNIVSLLNFFLSFVLTRTILIDNNFESITNRYVLIIVRIYLLFAINDWNALLVRFHSVFPRFYTLF